MRSCRVIRLMAASLVLAASTALASDQRASESVEFVTRLAGCFEVTYRFAEDGSHDMFSPDWGLDDPVREWVGLEETADGTIVLRHVSITDDGRAVPHWYEAWKFQSDQKGWTQEVWSHTPGDGRSRLRYRCTAPWQKNLWDCHAGKAPKPFRDAGAVFGFSRTDYDWLDRRNTLLVTPKGWIQFERNQKMASTGQVVSYELGWITYRRIGQDACAPAIDQFTGQDAQTR